MNNYRDEGIEVQFSGDHMLFTVDGIKVMSVIHSHDDDSEVTYWDDDDTRLERAYKAWQLVLMRMYGHIVEN